MIDAINAKAKELKDQGHNPTHVYFDQDTYDIFSKMFDPGEGSYSPHGADLGFIMTDGGKLQVVVVPSSKDRIGFQIGISF